MYARTPYQSVTVQMMAGPLFKLFMMYTVRIELLSFKLNNEMVARYTSQTFSPLFLLGILIFQLK